ncbi:hypothetical protein HMPREF3034_01224 [Prevotella sp. DNF00663]|nr:hypothetical protein [Prevotella sp. DNF00663]KXB83329.1 hypothetical protein HMPREF3034_01224 [Prevotella sp. DNF00663]
MASSWLHWMEVIAIPLVGVMVAWIPQVHTSIGGKCTFSLSSGEYGV